MMSPLSFSPLEIRLSDVKCYAHHGVLPQETKVGARFTLHLLLRVESTEAALHNDQLSGTVSYAEVLEVVQTEMAQPSQLLEHVVARILQSLFLRFSLLRSATVTLQKDNPPLGAELSGCSVTLSATRNDQAIDHPNDGLAERRNASV